MAQQSLIARAGKGLLDLFVLLLRGIGSLCSALGSFLIWAFAQDSSTSDSLVDEHDFYDGQSLIEKEEEARIQGWKSW